VIIGGGLAGISAIETLLKSGYGGKITLVSKEQTLPYDRTILSKNIQVKD
jgi:NADPH-dependent 2,4-dienoyl-CoA reductase/sulfur reductase-like enzyme